MNPKLIKTEAEYDAAMARIEILFTAKPGTPEGNELELLTTLVELYEEKHFPVDLPDPIAAIQFRMAQQGLKAKDLIPYIGSASKVSEVLAGKRSLSLTMIQNLVENFGIPAEVFLKTPRSKSPTDTVEKWKYLDEHLRLRLTSLSSKQFEIFFLHFLRSGISLTIERNGQPVTKRVISAETYAAGTGRSQKGVDLRVVVEGNNGKEEWAFQCKNHKTWSPEQTRTAIQDAGKYQAQHYFLVVGCDPHEEVQEEIKKHAAWSFWNLDTICAEFRLKVPTTAHANALFFLPPEELKRFIPFATEALLSPATFFEKYLGAEKTFRHDWPLVGRQEELKTLHNFITAPHKVQMLCAKGGDGKTRLLWEFCRTLAVQSPSTQILFLNPHRGSEDFSFAFVGTPSKRLIVIDDAHRTEQVPLELLSLVRQDPNAKLLLGTRPQGVEALTQKCYETDLGKLVAPMLSLSILKRSETKNLAAEVLGPKFSDHASDLAELTHYSPFLTVVAGELLRQKRLTWGKWSSDAEFRRQVFVEFEVKNLESIAEIDRARVKSLLRLLALLAPVQRTHEFIQAAARCLDCSVFEIETSLNRLQQSELLAGRHNGLRVVPDLFSDFLVYDVCYEPQQKMPTFAGQVLREFSGHSAALLRNLSEATWIARANGLTDDTLIKPLVEEQYRQFEASSFYRRAEILRHWSNFSVYLPAETLNLVKKALDTKIAPKDETENLVGFNYVGIQDNVMVHLPTLLKPIAKYHDEYRRPALDMAWNLGLASLKNDAERSDNHPWSVITGVIKFEPKKPVAVIMDGLAWLDLTLSKPENLQHLEGKRSVLRLIISRCFNRGIEWTWSEGRTIHMCRQVVTGHSFKVTQEIRNRAFEILSKVIENTSWLAALDAIEALEEAVKRVVGYDVDGVKDIEALRLEWRPERLKALRLLSRTVAKHPNPPICYKVRQLLKWNLAHEEDLRFAEEAKVVLAEIPENLALRTTIVLLAENSFEFEETISFPFTSEKQELSRKLWDERVRQTALELSKTYPKSSSLVQFLNGLTLDLVRAGFSMLPTKLFLALAASAPEVALGLAKELIGGKADPSLAFSWNWLLEGNSMVSEQIRNSLLKKAAESGNDPLVFGTIQTLGWLAKQNTGLTEAEKAILLGIATIPSEEASYHLLQFIAWAKEEMFPWAFQLLERIPIRKVEERKLESILQALSPYTERTTPVPSELLEKILKHLVDVPSLGYGHHREWTQLSQRYPSEVYRFIIARIVRATRDDKVAGYQPFTSDVDEALDFAGLSKEPTFSKICSDLWEQVLDRKKSQHYYWQRLFQMIVLPHEQQWVKRLQGLIENTGTEDDLFRIPGLLKFDNSLLVFQRPELTRALLSKAQLIGGNTAFERMRHCLHSAAGPGGRSYSNGVLDPEQDYVESEAAKAASTHADDDLLGPFYQWMVELEQKDRAAHKMRAEIDDMDSLD